MLSRPIALITDFGRKDHYVGSLKGVILAIHPKAVILDITHEIQPQNIREAAFVLRSVYPHLPQGAIVVVVVDPTVGSNRRALCIRTRTAYLMGPDNGVFSMVLSAEKNVQCRVVTNDRYFRKPVSATFHGRDIFAPVAAWLSRSDIFRSLGPVVKKIRQLKIPRPVFEQGVICGKVIYIDRFGNAMTNISFDSYPQSWKSNQVRIHVGRRRNVPLKRFFSEGKGGELIALWNSNRDLELAVREGSAERRFGMKVGDSVQIWREER